MAGAHTANFDNPVRTAVTSELLLLLGAVWIFTQVEGVRAGVKYAWLTLAGSLYIGVSFAFPMFLAFWIVARRNPCPDARRGSFPFWTNVLYVKASRPAAAVWSAWMCSCLVACSLCATRRFLLTVVATLLASVPAFKEFLPTNIYTAAALYAGMGIVYVPLPTCAGRPVVA